MSTIFVAIDVETTGLDPDRDAIIEVGVVVFDRTGAQEEFSSLVYPQRDIPVEIIRLTGITDEMVHDAPTIGSLRSRLRRIVGDHVIVGHNIGFDMGFLSKAFVGSGNPRLDTVKLASIMLPAAGRYGLGALVEALQLPVAKGDRAHRALADARSTMELFLALLETARKMGLPRLNEIVQTGRRISWPETTFFEEALAELAQHAFEKGMSRRPIRQLYNPPRVEGQTLAGGDDEAPRQIDSEAISDMVSATGNFARLFPGDGQLA